MFRITADFFRQTNRCLRLTKDILIVPPIPREELTRYDLLALRNRAISDKTIQKILPDHLCERLAYENPKEILWALKRLYLDHCKSFSRRTAGKKSRKWRDPAWVEKLPRATQIVLQYNALHSEKYKWHDALYCFDYPYLGFNYVLKMDGRVGDLTSVSRIWRQQEHPQLSNKCDPITRLLDKGCLEKRSRQRRLWHELDNYVVNVLVGFNLRDHLSPYQRRNFSAAGLLHDNQIPLWGDEVMEIDLAAFCEEANFRYTFKNRQWGKYRKKHGLSDTKIMDAVQGRGLPGDIQDKNDKITYSALDTANLVEIYRDSPQIMKIPWLYKLCDLVTGNPDLFTIWDCIEIRDGKVFFTDPSRVGDFLTARAIMFRNVYYGEYSRSTGTTLTKSVVDLLYWRGIFKREDFYTKSLEEMDARVGNFVGHPNIMQFGDRSGNPRLETFANPEEAYRREKELYDRGIVLSAIEDCRGKIKPATHFLVQTPDGRILPFAEAYPKKAAIIHKICQISRPIYLMYLNSLIIPDESYRQMREYKRQQFAQRGQI